MDSDDLAAITGVVVDWSEGELPPSTYSAMLTPRAPFSLGDRMDGPPICERTMAWGIVNRKC